MNWRAHWMVMVLSLVVLNACSLRQVMVAEMTGLVEDGLAAYEQDSDLDLVERSFPANIKLLETLLANDPHNESLLVLLARLYGSYAFAFVEPRLEAVQTGIESPDSGSEAMHSTSLETLQNNVNRYYRKGARYAGRALSIRHSGWEQRLHRVAEQKRVLGSMSAEDVPALFWYGFIQGLYINRNLNSVTSMSKIHGVVGALHRVIELVPDYYHGSAHLFMMTYFGSRPPSLGGDLQKTIYHYQQLGAIAGGEFLLADLYYARYYLYQRQDREAFTETLEQLINRADKPNPYPLLNAVAARKARLYLSATDMLFD